MDIHGGWASTKHAFSPGCAETMPKVEEWPSQSVTWLVPADAVPGHVMLAAEQHHYYPAPPDEAVLHASAMEARGKLEEFISTLTAPFRMDRHGIPLRRCIPWTLATARSRLAPKLGLTHAWDLVRCLSVTVLVRVWNAGSGVENPRYTTTKRIS